MNLPNKLTLARIIAVPFFIALYMTEHFFLALLLFILASLTDLLDGKIARSRNLITSFGKIMDPLADKILVYSAFCLFVADGLFPAWMLAVILAREFLVSGMRTVAASEGIVIAADMSGKIKTVLQMIAVPIVILLKATGDVAMSVPSDALVWEPPANRLELVAQIVLWLALIMTVVSGAEYVIKNRDIFKSK